MKKNQPALPNYLHLLVVLFIFSLTISGSYAQRFSINGTQIKDSSGAEFVPIGANIAGWNFHDWVHNAVDDADVIEQAWNFNIVRANTYLKATTWNGTLTNGGKTWRNNTAECTAALDAIVNKFTAKKIVVMLEVHDWTCTYPTTTEDIQLLNDFWSWAANRYKSNSYVWFNIMNEPQWDTANGNASYSWVTTHRPIIQLIRDQIGADNIIIVDGVNCGQETQTWNNNPIPAAQSAVITYGNDLKNFNNKTYANIGFNFHMYGAWGLNNTQSDTKLTDYIIRVHNLGHCIFIGEVGSTGLTDKDQVENPGSAYRAALLGKRVGMLAWHWNPKDGYKLTDTGSGAAINSWTNPTNLSSWAGKYFWDATHKDGFGLSVATLVISEPEVNSQATEFIAVYPNPSEGQFVINYFSPVNQRVNIRMLDMQGKVLLTNHKQVEKGLNIISLNAGKDKTGLYLINLIPSVSKTHINTKIIID